VIVFEGEQVEKETIVMASLIHDILRCWEWALDAYLVKNPDVYRLQA
jgi:hypothetical protein